jgi:hypothetical protein
VQVALILGKFPLTAYGDKEITNKIRRAKLSFEVNESFQWIF